MLRYIALLKFVLQRTYCYITIKLLNSDEFGFAISQKTQAGRHCLMLNSTFAVSAVIEVSLYFVVVRLKSTLPF